MTKRNLMKRLVAGVAAIAMMGTVSVNAASISAYLYSSASKVSTTFTSSGYSEITVSGYEIHPTTDHIVYYDKVRSYTGGGNTSVVHTADAGYEFQLVHWGTYLYSTVYTNGVLYGKVKVS